MIEPQYIMTQSLERQPFLPFSLPILSPLYPQPYLPHFLVTFFSPYILPSIHPVQAI